MHRSADRDAPMLPQPFRVMDTREEISGCMTLRVVPVNNAGNTVYEPGQFYMVYFFGRGEVPISVSGDPRKTGELTFTIMDVGSVTHAIYSIKAGDTIGLRGPFGSAWPIGPLKGRDVIVVAGGLGLAPLRPALYHMLNNRNDYGELLLAYGARKPETILFEEELNSWREKAPIDVDVNVNAAGRDWLGKVGVVTDLLKDRSIDPVNTSAVMCGPEIMMRFSAYALLNMGVAADKIYLSMERNMKCAIRLCGRCQYGPFFICHDGPVFSFDRIEHLLKIREV
ncbi:Anaerobic sulfite reductase subunit B [Pseudovibrio axinellae]|uniref:Anaerobic sulfite reductase subunit B n=1 Tax=Pseudovibrio axinellae TaxID=989403 RepID=A0A165WA61_9HYPH|nr:FAD/NAD(P)-binding protein [Pseudovibrio axinellae]KZL16273.1 Anaerobic sulfite reductase subunit B [Pseudovibrio axinellae]SER78629.1 NAD(P)H-flavin reductase [Pseudovibrio axinellae]